LEFDLKENEIIDVEINYPIESNKDLNICEYQQVFWCKPGFFIDECPIILMNVFDEENQKYRLKGCVLDTIINDEKVIYKIKLKSCNCLFSKLLNNENLKAEIEILPKSSVDSFGIYKSSNLFVADKFTI
jgi:hypothetical protein